MQVTLTKYIFIENIHIHNIGKSYFVMAYFDAGFSKGKHRYILTISVLNVQKSVKRWPSIVQSTNRQIWLTFVYTQFTF